MSEQIEAGWYPDPQLPGMLRLWDGVQWRLDVAPVQASLVADAAVKDYKYREVRHPRDMNRLLRKGWELVTSSGRQNWFWGSDFRATLRKQR